MLNIWYNRGQGQLYDYVVAMLGKVYNQNSDVIHRNLFGLLAQIAEMPVQHSAQIMMLMKEVATQHPEVRVKHRYWQAYTCWKYECKALCRMHRNHRLCTCCVCMLTLLVHEPIGVRMNILVSCFPIAQRVRKQILKNETEYFLKT